MLVDSGLLNDLEQYVFCNGQPMCLYGVQAYPLRVHLQTPFRSRQLTRRVQQVNECCPSVSREWIFGDIINYFKFLDFKRNLKIGLSSVGKMYIVE